MNMQDSMPSIYSQFLTDEELFVGIYGLRNPTVKPLRLGIDNDVYHVTSDNKGKTVLRVGKRSIGKSIEFETSLLKHLKTEGVKVPTPIQAVDKRDYIVLPNNNVLSMFSFVSGISIEVTKDQKPSRSIVFNAAAELGRMHKSTENLEINTEGRRTIYTEMERAIKVKYQISENYEGGVNFINEVEEYKSWAISKYFPSGIIHNDFAPENIMFNEEKVSAIIDFDWASPGPFLKDLGLALAYWSFPDDIDEPWGDVIEEFLRGYNSTAPHEVRLNNSLYRWMNFSCLSDAATFFADLVGSQGWSQKEEKIIRITQNHRYQKFLYLKSLLDS